MNFPENQDFDPNLPIFEKMAKQRKANFRSFLTAIMGTEGFDDKVDAFLDNLTFSNYLDKRGFSKIQENFDKSDFLLNLRNLPQKTLILGQKQPILP